MKLVFSDLENETSSGYVTEESLTGGSPILKDMAVPAGLFFLQHAFQNKTPNYKVDNDSSVVSETLYDRLLGLVGESNKRKTRKVQHGGKQNKKKTKKNN